MTRKLQRLPTMSYSLLILVVISLMLMHSEAASDAVYHTCNTKGGSNYTKGSALDMNVQHVFTTLPNAAAASKQGYNSTVYGRAPNTVYALAECRGDTTASQCLSCLQDAVVSLQNLCGRLPGGQVWFDMCFLRWENNTNFLGQPDTNSGISLINTANASNPKVFSTAVIGLVTNLTKEVVKPNNSRRYATGNFTDSSFHKIYALAQCWKDVSIDDCQSCLSGAVDTISSYATSLGGQRLTDNCIARYETYSFFNASASPPPPPSPRILPPSPPPVSINGGNSDSNSKSKLAIILGSIGGSVLLLLLLFSSCYFAVRRKRQAFQTEAGNAITRQSSFPNGDQQIFYNIGTLMAATSNFSDDCKLGEGGFGVVYKGTLPNGKEVAVKKLSVRSSQGKKEFLNEIRLVARIQHRNLVNLLGCCTDGSERILVYEYLTNKSLDKFLFDSEKAKLLDWQKRVNIILGVARGLVYLHEDSKLRIIHRDIKASNILLDDKFNAKIADFGLAKLFSEDQSRMQTGVAGTYGYMAPEYVMHGQLSTKADVYSFGVLLLEIISGRKNNGFISENVQTFLGWAWSLYREGNFIGIVDETLKASCNYEQVVRCIHVGFLCTQGDPSLRLPMSEVTMMLSSNSVSLPSPTMPAFLNISQTYGHGHSSEVSSQYGNPSPLRRSPVQYGMSASDSITIVEPR